MDRDGVEVRTRRWERYRRGEMNLKEAQGWLNGSRSMCNLVAQLPFESWQVRIAQADAAMIEQAYWIAQAHKEGLVEGGKMKFEEKYKARVLALFADAMATHIEVDAMTAANEERSRRGEAAAYDEGSFQENAGKALGIAKRIRIISGIEEARCG